MQLHRFNVFGRIFAIQRKGEQWQAYAVGAEGKRSPAGFVVPEFIAEHELTQYLADLFHESATVVGATSCAPVGQKRPAVVCLSCWRTCVRDSAG